jgi:hypothetical protein
MIITVERDGHFRLVKEEGSHELNREDLSMLLFVLARGKTHRGFPIYHKAVMDLKKPLILVLILLLGVLLLVIFLDAQAFKVLSEHVAVLKVVVCGPLVVGTRFLENFIKNAPVEGPRGFLRSVAVTRLSATASRLPWWFFFFLLLFLLAP